MCEFETGRSQVTTRHTTPFLLYELLSIITVGQKLFPSVCRLNLKVNIFINDNYPLNKSYRTAFFNCCIVCNVGFVSDRHSAAALCAGSSHQLWHLTTNAGVFTLVFTSWCRGMKPHRGHGSSLHRASALLLACLFWMYLFSLYSCTEPWLLPSNGQSRRTVRKCKLASWLLLKVNPTWDTPASFDWQISAVEGQN